MKSLYQCLKIVGAAIFAAMGYVSSQRAFEAPMSPNKYQAQSAVEFFWGIMMLLGISGMVMTLVWFAAAAIIKDDNAKH